MNTGNVPLIFFVKSHRTSFIKHKYLTGITGTLITLKLIIPSQTVFGKKICQTLGKGL